MVEKLEMPAEELITSWGLMMEAVTAVRARLAAGLEAGGITLHEFDVLIRLLREPTHHLPMTRVAAEIGLSGGGFSKLADRMEDEGLIVREAAEHDRRIIYAALTERGTQTVLGVMDHHIEDLRRTIERPLGTARLRELASISRELRGHRP